MRVVPRKSVTFNNTTICRSKVAMFTNKNSSFLHIKPQFTNNQIAKRFYSEQAKDFQIKGVVEEMTDFPPKINQLVESYTALNVAEQMLFFRALCKRLNIPFETMMQGGGGGPAYYAPTPGGAIPPGAPGGAAPADAAGAAGKDGKKDAGKKEEKKEEKSTVTIKLVKLADGAKYKVLKEIRTLKPGMSVADSKNFVENLPSVLAEGVSKEEAAKWEQKIKEAGGELAME